MLPLPPALSDAARLAAIDEARLLDGGPARLELERVARLAARLVGLPSAVTVVDATTQHVVARGGPLPGILPDRLDAADALCPVLVVDPRPLVIADIAAEPRLAALPAAGRLGVRAYAAAPLVTQDGHVLGGVCVASRAAHAFGADVAAILEDLADAASAYIELGRAARRVAAREAELELVLRSVSDHLHVVEARPPHRVVVANPAFLRRRRLEPEAALGRTLAEIGPPDDALRAEAILAEVRETGRTLRFADTVAGPDGEIALDCVVSPVEGRGAVDRLLVVGRDVTAERRQEEALQAALADRERLLAEQVALRRVAEAAAGRSEGRALYAVIGEECARLLGAIAGGVVELNGHGPVLRGGWHEDGAERLDGQLDRMLPPDAELAVAAAVGETGRPVHLGPGPDGPDGAPGGARLVAPIRVDGRLWGALGVVAAHGARLPAAAAPALERFAEIAGVAIGDALARARLERRLATEHALADAAAEILAATTAHAVHAIALDALLACVPAATRAAVFCEDAAGRLALVAGHGWGAAVGRRGYRRGTGALADRALSSEAVLVADVAAGPAPALPPDLRDDSRSVIAAGIPATGEPAHPGLLVCGSTAPHAFREEDAAAVRTLAHLVGGAVARIERDLRLEHAARTDELTGLANRDLLTRAIADALERRRGGEPFAVLLIDLDRFKVVNDLHGHAFGDRALAAVAERLRERVPADVAIARFSADEFVLVAPGAALARAEELAAHVGAAIREVVVVDGQELALAASIGIVVPGEGQPTPGDVLRDADVALYRAKAAGRGRAVAFDGAMRASAIRHHRIERDLRAAIGRDLHLVYQPVVGVADGRVRAFEALARWPHPELPVEPSEFIPVAEESGLIRDLGRWAIAAACREAATWRGALETAPTVLVNVSAAELGPDLARYVAQVLEATGVPPAALALEVTERALLEDAPPTRAALAALADLGVRAYLDDFGTGQSSLAVLHRFAIHGVKLDASFTARLPHDRAAVAVVAAALAMARELGLDAVAEGVESPLQVAKLRDLGCTSVQGYLYARPLDAHDALHLAAARGVLV